MRKAWGACRPPQSLARSVSFLGQDERTEKMHGTPERAESGTAGMSMGMDMGMGVPRPASVETEMSDLSVC